MSLRVIFDRKLYREVFQKRIVVLAFHFQIIKLKKDLDTNLLHKFTRSDICFIEELHCQIFKSTHFQIDTFSN